MKNARLLIISIALSSCLFLAAQTSQNKTVDKSTQLIEKLSKDIELTDAQKSAIHSRFEALDAKYNKKNETSLSPQDSLYRMEAKATYKEIMGKVLTPEQIQMLKEKREKQKQERVKICMSM
jgi:hypothetical protein